MIKIGISAICEIRFVGERHQPAVWAKITQTEAPMLRLQLESPEVRCRVNGHCVTDAYWIKRGDHLLINGNTLNWELIDTLLIREPLSGYNRPCTPEKITRLAKNEIFVFGSNLAGFHGSGAARFAYEQFGAEWGEGVGLFGQSYAIPTMHGGVSAVKPYVDQFIVFAAQRPDLIFWVTKIGCGIAGFTTDEMAPLFAEAVGLDNVLLPRDFVVRLKNITQTV